MQEVNLFSANVLHIVEFPRKEHALDRVERHFIVSHVNQVVVCVLLLESMAGGMEAA